MFRLILATLVALAGPVSADTPLDKMVENERRAMNGLPDSRLVSFLQRPARQIEYSGDWLAAVRAALSAVRRSLRNQTRWVMTCPDAE